MVKGYNFQLQIKRKNKIGNGKRGLSLACTTTKAVKILMGKESGKFPMLLEIGILFRQFPNFRSEKNRCRERKSPTGRGREVVTPSGRNHAG